MAANLFLAKQWHIIWGDWVWCSGPGDPPLVWPAIEMFCQDMIDYAERAQELYYKLKGY